MGDAQDPSPRKRRPLTDLNQREVLNTQRGRQQHINDSDAPSDAVVRLLLIEKLMKNAGIEHHKLGRNTDETEMATSPADRHPKPRHMDAEWNPGLVISMKTQRRAGKLTRRWKDDSNEFVKDEGTEATQSNDLPETCTNGKRKTYAKHGIDDWGTQPNYHQKHDITSNNVTTPTAATPRRRPSALRRRAQ